MDKFQFVIVKFLYPYIQTYLAFHNRLYLELILDHWVLECFSVDKQSVWMDHGLFMARQ